MTLFTPAPSLGALLPKAATFRGSTPRTEDLSEYTFSDIDIGSSSNDRFVIVAAGNISNRALSSITINGVAADIVVQEQSGNGETAIAIANVQSGTTATVVVTWAVATPRMGFAWWTAVGLTSGTAHDTGSSAADPGTDTLNTLAGGFIIGYMVSNAGGTFTWTGATERFDETIETNTVHTGADATTDGNPLAITADESVASSNNSFVCASW